MRAAHRCAIFVASLIFAVNGISTVRGQSGGASGVRPATSGSTARPKPGPAGNAGATAPRQPSAPAGGIPASPVATKSAPAATTVVVIDIGEVFKKHTGFNQQIESIKKEMKDLEALAQTEQRRLANSAQKLEDLKSGSPEYKKLEEELAHTKSELQVSMALKQKAIMEREARIYFDTHREILQEVGEFADRHNISLVLRHSNFQMDPQKRDSVFRGLERPIVFQRNLDITEEIIGRVNRGVARTAAPPRNERGSVVPASGATDRR